MEFESNEFISLVLRRCPFCGHTRSAKGHMSWCEYHDEVQCPKCGLCPEAVPRNEADDDRQTIRRLATEVQAFRSEQEG